MIRTTTAFLLGAATAVALVRADNRFETLAPEPEETAAQIAALPLSLAGAVDKAEAEVGGHARSADLVLEGASATYTVDVFGAEGSARVTLDGRTGEVTGREELRRLPGLPVEGDPYVSETGLVFYDIVEGDGDEVPSQSAMVRFHVNGYLTDGTLFDSTYADGNARMFPLERTFPGFREGVGTMKAGGKRKLILPFQLAYGEHGKPPTVPHRAMIVYDVELLEVLP